MVSAHHVHSLKEHSSCLILQCVEFFFSWLIIIFPHLPSLFVCAWKQAQVWFYWHTERREGGLAWSSSDLFYLSLVLKVKQSAIEDLFD